MGTGRLTAWTGLIKPFYDRPDITIPVLWYPAVQPFQQGIHTVFTDRFYDQRDHWFPPGVGTVPGSLKPYFGPVPPPVLGPQVGSDADFLNGVSYANYLASGGSPVTPCATVPNLGGRPKVRQGQGPVGPAWTGPSGLKTWGCVNCPQGAYVGGVLKVSGVANGTQSAAAVNGVFSLAHVTSCVWRSNPFTVFGSTVARWNVTIRPTGTRIELQMGPTFTTDFALFADVLPLSCVAAAHAVGPPTTQTADFGWNAASLTWTPAAH